jgi:hypothetical protein
MVAENAEKEWHFADWMSEGVEGLKSRRRRIFKHFMPKEFRAHMKAARKEMLLAFRSLLDEAIERTETETQNPPKATKIKVE